MSRIFVWELSPVVLVMTAGVLGCSGNGNGAGDASVDSYGVIVPGGDGASDEGGDADAAPENGTTMRLAHASPDLGPIDFCWRPTGAATFTGPVLGGGQQLPEAGAGSGDAGDAGSATDAQAGQDASDAGALGDSGHDEDAAHADSGDGGSQDAGLEAASPLDAGPRDAALDGGIGDASFEDVALVDAGAPEGGSPTALVFGAMTPVVTLPTGGTFDIAIVAAGQTSCVMPRIAGTVTLDAGKRATVVLMGRALQDSGPDALAVVGFTDAPLEPESARIRFIHAALGSASQPAAPSLSVRAGDTVLASELDPQHASTASTSPAVDGLGYTTLSPLLPPTTLQLGTVGDAAEMHWTTAPTDLGVQVGTAHTGIVVSLGQGALGIAWCADSSTAGGAATCVLLPALGDGQ